MKKDSFYSKLSFYLSLGFWIPLFNVGLSIVSMIIAIRALRLVFKEPKKYGGLGYAVTALILSISSIIITITGLILFLMSERICTSQLCQLYSQS